MRSSFRQAAVLVTFKQEPEQSVLRTVSLQYVVGRMNRIAWELRHPNLFYLAAFAQGFVQILQVGGPSCQDDSCQQFVLVAR